MHYTCPQHQSVRGGMTRILSSRAASLRNFVVSVIAVALDGGAALDEWSSEGLSSGCDRQYVIVYVEFYLPVRLYV